MSNIQPSAETLAEAREAAALAFDVRARKASHPEVATLERDHAKVIRAGEGDEYDAVQAAVIALTRRAGGDAIPAKEAFDAWRRAQPSGDERFPYDIAKAAFIAGRESATPKPPAGGDAGDKQRYRQALEDVCNPFGYLQRLAEAEGAKLSGLAYSIATDISTVQSIARDALNHE